MWCRLRPRFRPRPSGRADLDECRHRSSAVEKAAADQVGLAALGAGDRWGHRFFLALVTERLPVNWTRVWEGLPREVPRWCRHFSRPILSPAGTKLPMALLKAVDDGRFDRGRDCSFDSGRRWRGENIAPAPIYYFCCAVLAVSRSFQEIILAIFLVKLLGFGPFAGFVTLSLPRLASTANCLPKISRTWTRARRKRCGRPAQAGCNGSTTACSRK